MSNSAVFFVALFRMLSSSGGGQAVQDSLSCPPPTWVSKKNYFAKSIYFKLLIVKTYQL